MAEPPPTGLPVETALPSLREALARTTAAVLTAPPGSGKTTLVPLALMAEPWLAGRRIVMLEPRRLATRQAAQRMAALLGEQTGQRVGYAMRFERRVSAATRVEILTEGLFVRRLQADPGLDDIGLVIFDEFHERSLDADLGLALLREVQASLRPDLRLLVMSATLDAAALAAFLDACSDRHRHRPPARRSRCTIGRIPRRWTRSARRSSDTRATSWSSCPGLPRSSGWPARSPAPTSRCTSSTARFPRPSRTRRCCRARAGARSSWRPTSPRPA